MKTNVLVSNFWFKNQQFPDLNMCHHLAFKLQEALIRRSLLLTTHTLIKLQWPNGQPMCPVNWNRGGIA